MCFSSTVIPAKAGIQLSGSGIERKKAGFRLAPE
jgi:hypothetical protein